MRVKISICLLAVFAIFHASCVDNRQIHYYSFEPPRPPVTSAVPADLVLLVGNISVPPALQDGRIRYRTGSSEVGAYEFHRWIERPSTMVGSSLVNALRASGKYRSVLESGSSESGDYLVRGKLYEFGEVDGESIKTSISLHVEMVDMKTRRVVWDDLVDRDEPVTTKSVKDVVQSLDRNLQAVTNEAAGKIDKFLSANVK